MQTFNLTPEGNLHVPKRIREKYGIDADSKLVFEEKHNAVLIRLLPKNDNKTNIASLTEREMQVLELLAEGLSYKLIADKLHLSFYTINAHCKNIYNKLNVSSSGEAIARYYKKVVRIGEMQN